MEKSKYSASLSQSQGRPGYSVIFRHPVLKDEKTGKPGKRVRRGLGTNDVNEAESLCEELNIILGDSRYHQLAARSEAEGRFKPLVVDIFFDKMIPENTDFEELRESIIPLPNSEPDGYRRVLLLGTTGAGKTTLVRQLIGSNPEKDRFPSTSTAKTTTYDIELILKEGNWNAAVTFASYDEIRDSLYECISAAVLSAWKNASDAEVLRRLLNHVDQRFRFSYVLGNGTVDMTNSGDFEDFEDEPIDNLDIIPNEDGAGIDLNVTNQLLTKMLVKINELAKRLGREVRAELGVKGKEDEQVADELFEDELDNLLRDEEEYHQIADELMVEIEKRFELLPPGKVQKTKQGWPMSWFVECPIEEREKFLRAVLRFSSNYAPLFGRLLTPLVNGVRVAGPFLPEWNDGLRPKLILLDGEGLGHTPDFSSAVSTRVSRRIKAADAVVLVDNATQPMQAAPLAAISDIVTSGNSRKLIFAFTHFDEVKGDNLPTIEAKVQHVRSSAENVLATFGEKLGPSAERALAQRLDNARFFLADIQEILDEKDKSGKRTITQLRKLLNTIETIIERPQAVKARPVYEQKNLVLAILRATEAFHKEWRPKLGLEYHPITKKAPWQTIKALSRRLAYYSTDEYGQLMPVADLRKHLLQWIYKFVQNPLDWEGSEPKENEKQACYDTFAEYISVDISKLCTLRLKENQIVQWQAAYDERGSGSTFIRARKIGDEIYENAAPVPDVTPSPDKNQFLHEVIEVVKEAAKNTNIVLI